MDDAVTYLTWAARAATQAFYRPEAFGAEGLRIRAADLRRQSERAAEALDAMAATMEGG